MIREEKIQIPFVYAAGQAGSRFLVALRDDGRIMGSACAACGHVSVPTRSFCPACSESDLSDVELAGEGNLVSWTEIPGRGVFALINLDGADGALLHRLIDSPDKLAVGQRVRAQFAETRKAHISDLAGFVVTGAGP
ncbi:MAG: Zn-ribbon domain-containing OB-fold protein [Proteobacteria bacterium]|nr:Zn-ribbon domain-containing OB-fold protein [Pseudomonadota bacterium]